MGSDKAKVWGAKTRGEILLYDPKDLTIVGLDTKHKSVAEHPLYDERVKYKVPETMIANAYEFGTETVILVRRNGEDESGKPIIEVEDGRQRTRAQRIANERRVAAGLEPFPIRAMPKAADGIDALRLGHRANLRISDNPMVRARKMQAQLDLGGTMETLLSDFGCTRPTVDATLRLLDCSKEVQKALESDQISMSVALKLAVLPREKQDEELAALLEKGLTGGEASEAVDEVVGDRPRKKKSLGRVWSKKKIHKIMEALDGVGTQQALFARAIFEAVAGNPKALLSGYGKISEVVSEIEKEKVKRRKRAKRAKAVAEAAE